MLAAALAAEDEAHDDRGDTGGLGDEDELRALGVRVETEPVDERLRSPGGLPSCHPGKGLDLLLDLLDNRTIQCLHLL